MAANDNSALPPLKEFALERLLSYDARECRAAVLGRFEGREAAAVLLLSRRHFDLDQLSQLLSSCSQATTTFHNDIYSKHTTIPDASYNQLVVDAIYPATEKHIQKHTAQRRHVVRETPRMFTDLVAPYIAALPATRTQWVYNILNKQAEAERLIYEDTDPDTGFMVHPDLKWDQVQTEQLYCVLMVQQRGLRSLRDLGGCHLPLLLKIRDQVPQVLSERFGVPADQLRMFLHYPPSYYHLHVHVAHVAWEGPALMAGRAHLLEDVIDNLERFGDAYYPGATLTYTLGEDEELWRLMQQQKQQPA